MMSTIEEARNAFAAIDAARAKVAVERDKLAALQQRKAAEDAERTQLREAIESEAARRIIDGNEEEEGA
ncbi:hypothetical protein [Rhizorhapis sp.]|uniref:hypothetical protein n=1 Tax=Rhizorhapis sp. TaxID=1968842 RepID=UPI002B45D35E|nr:hypothetical protein [Rhizorhapis sp.]HKR16617.1 hypothetical protein [Rhizorhapis sp.]